MLVEPVFLLCGGQLLSGLGSSYQVPEEPGWTAGVCCGQGLTPYGREEA